MPDEERRPIAAAQPVWWVALVVIAVDRITKIAILRTLAEGASVPVIPRILHLTAVFNEGIAFGLLQRRGALPILISCIVIIGIVLYAIKAHRQEWRIAVPLGLILGGAIGNLVDRLRYGFVIDFLDFRVWPVFNVADAAINIGVFLLMLRIVRVQSGLHQTEER